VETATVEGAKENLREASPQTIKLSSGTQVEKDRKCKNHR